MPERYSDEDALLKNLKKQVVNIKLTQKLFIQIFIIIIQVGLRIKKMEKKY